MVKQEHDKGQWQLDRKIPVMGVIALLLPFLSNIFFLGWWGAKTDARIAAVEVVQANNANVATRLTTVEVQTTQSRSDLQDVKGSLQRIEDRLYQITMQLPGKREQTP